MEKSLRRERLSRLIRSVLILNWMARLRDTSSYYAVYLLLGTGGFLAVWRGGKGGVLSRRERGWTAAFSALLTVMVTAANYDMFAVMKTPLVMGAAATALWRVMTAGWSLACGWVLFYSLLGALAARLRDFSWGRPAAYTARPAAVFFAVMAAAAAVDLAVLFLTAYPGVLSTDSVRQIEQIVSGTYTNHHPFYHTMLIRGCVKLGQALFHSMEAGACLYSVAQILFMAAVFAYVTVTLYEMRLPKTVVAAWALWYILMPFHILYSFTMWKDVVFGGAAAVFVTALFRWMYGMGKRRWANWVLTALGGLGVCLFRSNGLAAFALTLIVAALVLRRKGWPILLVMAAVLAAALVLKYPVLNRLDVAPPDLAESLSIPIQQIARVITDCDDLTAEERELLDRVVDVDAVPEAYENYISDPVKELMRAQNGVEYLAAHKGDYLRLWFRLLLRHPWTYIAAWIDQTRGYWNGGYDYWVWSTGIYDNELGISRKVAFDLGVTVRDGYCWLFRGLPLLQLFTSIGLHVWLTMALGWFALLRRSRAGLLTVPGLAVVLTLLAATPVASEFRYAYLIFTCLPLISGAVFYQNDNEELVSGHG